MARLRRHWQAIGVAAWACACAATAASAQALGPEARRFAKCERIPDARRLDAKQPAGVAAVNCAIAPGLRLAILLDETVSWPIARKGDQAWFPNTSPVRVRFDKDMYALVRGADRSSAVVYSGVVSRTDAEGNLPAFVAIRVAPSPCALAVTLDRAAALRTARDAKGPCLPPVANY
jgi:hypothetical protein